MNRLSSLFAALIAALALFCSSCVATGGQMVAYANFSGNGDARVTDDGYAFAMGEAQGSAGIYIRGSGFPLTIPLAQDKNTWVEFVDWKPARSGVLGVDPIPARAFMLYRTPSYPPGSRPEFEEVIERLGFTIEQIRIEPDPIYKPELPPSEGPPTP